jgi:FixJ family two-component response regulator
MRSEESAVCLVDDDPLVLNSLQHLLASDGNAARSFYAAETFFAHIEMHSVALVVLDIWMDGITGLEVQVRLSSMCCQTRVIFITAAKGLTMNASPCKRAQLRFSRNLLMTTNFSPLSTTRLIKLRARSELRLTLVAA